MIRVGFIITGVDTEWVGGAVYMANLMHAISMLPEPKIQPVIIAAPDTPDKVFDAFPPLEILRTPLVARRTLANLVSKIGRRIFEYDLALIGFLKSKNISVLSYSGDLGRLAHFPTTQWLPDFQHCRVPEFFAPPELAARDASFARVCRTSSVIILSSEDAQRDLAAFDATAVSRSRILHFVSGFGAVKNADISLAELQQKYDFDGHYFHLPNQFWAHKNHRVVIEALALLKEQGKDFLVLATGHTRDRRQPEHFKQLMRYVAEKGVEDRFRVLGLVPYGDLAALMRHAVAVVNPSLFEGWSTTVEESKSLGKSIMLSNIPVHLEQAPQWGTYFDPKNPAELAARLSDVQAQYSADVDRSRQEDAKAALNGRVREFALTYQDIVLTAAGVA
jgi:glycosyltransferase involved in cell wall biosynthesis